MLLRGRWCILYGAWEKNRRSQSSALLYSFMKCTERICRHVRNKNYSHCRYRHSNYEAEGADHHSSDKAWLQEHTKQKVYASLKAGNGETSYRTQCYSYRRLNIFCRIPTPTPQVSYRAHSSPRRIKNPFKLLFMGWWEPRLIQFPPPAWYGLPLDRW